MLEFIKSMVRRDKRQWCGVCLFELNPTAKSLPSDVGERWEYAFADSDNREFTFRDLVKSSERGCNRCTAFIRAFKTLEIGVHEATWNPCVNSPGSPLLEITTADGAKQNLEICCSDASLDKPVLFTDEPPSPHPALCRGYKLSRSTGDDKSLSQAAAWLAACRDSHDECQAYDATFVPTRLLYLGKEQTDRQLLELVENLEHAVPYAALSHRWTQETPTKSLLTTNMPDRRQNGMPLSSLPEMMQDAVSVLRRLGIEYVWIDCLCIVQDDKEDWKREASLMASIYKNADITIAASWCDKVGQRLFRDHSAPHESGVDVAEIGGQSIFIRRRKPHFSWMGDESYWFGLAMTEDPELEWPTLTRGWVYQEQLLSRRMLHFTRNELVWECLEATQCECGWLDNNNVRHQGATGSYKRATSDKSWVEVIKEYAKRPLTVATDRLPALGGIAKTTAVAKGYGTEEYLCGLWENELESTLFWYLTEPPRGPRPNPQIPTWSWASVDGDKECWQTSLESIEFLGSDVKYASGSDPFLGDVVSGTLTLAGHVVPGIIHHGPDWTKNLEAMRDATDTSHLLISEKEADYGLQICGQFTTFSPDYSLDLPGNDFVSSGSQVFCLLFGRTTLGEMDPEGEGTETVRANLLVLHRTSEDPPRYERIGVNECSIELDRFLSQSERYQLTLV